MKLGFSYKFLFFLLLIVILAYIALKYFNVIEGVSGLKKAQAKAKKAKIQAQVPVPVQVLAQDAKALSRARADMYAVEPGLRRILIN
jgi:hypothetical protein